MPEVINNFQISMSKALKYPVDLRNDPHPLGILIIGYSCLPPGRDH
jgi:hypothetical protein